MNKKENTPYIVLEALEPFLSKQGELFITDESKEDLIRFKSATPDSDFFFHIKSASNINGSFIVKLECKPQSLKNVAPHIFNIPMGKIEAYFLSWTTYLEKYNTIKSPFDDPIVESYAQEYYDEFDIVEEEKHKPLSSKVILLLDEHFDKIDKKLEGFRDESNSVEISKVQKEIIELTDNLTSKNRQWVATKISKIWAMTTKLGIKYYKEIVSVSRKEIFKYGAYKALDAVQEVIGVVEKLI